MSSHPIDPLEEYFFDLRGYLVIPRAIDPDHLHALNAWIDALPPLGPDQWLGNIYTHNYGGPDGMNLQDIIEAGEIFERLIDHPAWIGRARHYIGPSHPPYLYEAFLNIRGPGGYIGIHSGGHNVDHHQRSGRSHGQWVCSMLTLMLPLTDVGPGDGATTLIPGSHKADLPHPKQDRRGWPSAPPADDYEGAVPIYLQAGDALLFNDALAHGSSRRDNPGERRMLVIRYVPTLLGHRFGYVPSEELVARLSSERLRIVQPVTPRRPPREARS
jgi:hypothetical protein